MNWKKKGLLCSGADIGGNFHYAVAPAVLFLDDSRFRIYFTSRDSGNRSHIFSLLAAVEDDSLHIVDEKSNHLIAPGHLGSFDEDGAMSSWLIRNGNNIFLYYTGWNRALSVPFRLSIGLAVSADNGICFHKYSTGPLLDRNFIDQYLLASPCVIFDGRKWHMWYVSGVKWILEHGQSQAKHFYNVRCASSNDGLTWERTGKSCIDFQNEYEYAISRPSVILDKGIFKMWYSYRATPAIPTYRLGYAESDDGLSWIRKDEKVGIDVSAEGWDSEMICYPHVFKKGNKTFMLYNGNEYGKTGFGYAVLRES